MPSSKTSKHYTANTHARRHSGSSHERGIVKRNSKKDKDTDSDSISSSSSSTASKIEGKKCPMRALLLGLFPPEAAPGEDEKKGNGCPLRRIQLWHTIPLCLLAVVNLLLVIVALLGLAGYKIVLGVRDGVLGFGKPEVAFEEGEGELEVAGRGNVI